MFCGSQLVWLGATNTCTDILTVISRLRPGRRAREGVSGVVRPNARR